MQQYTAYHIYIYIHNINIYTYRCSTFCVSLCLVLTSCDNQKFGGLPSSPMAVLCTCVCVCYSHSSQSLLVTFLCIFQKGIQCVRNCCKLASQLRKGVVIWDHGREGSIALGIFMFFLGDVMRSNPPEVFSFPNG